MNVLFLVSHISSIVFYILSCLEYNKIYFLAAMQNIPRTNYLRKRRQKKNENLNRTKIECNSIQIKRNHFFYFSDDSMLQALAFVEDMANIHVENDQMNRYIHIYLCFQLKLFQYVFNAPIST